MTQKPSLSRALRNHSLAEVGLQPLCGLENGSLVAVEMPMAGASANGFPPSSGIRRALRTLPVPDAGAPYLCMSMDNRALTTPRLHEKMYALAGTHGLSPSRVCLFFSDQDCLPRGVAALDALIALKRSGFRVGLDIECLDALPVLFVERLPADVLRLGPLDAAVYPGDHHAFSRIRDFTRFADNLLMTTAAGGVTSTEQVSFLRDAGISVGQGPFFSGTKTLFSTRSTSIEEGEDILHFFQ